MNPRDEKEGKNELIGIIMVMQDNNSLIMSCRQRFSQLSPMIVKSYNPLHTSNASNHEVEQNRLYTGSAS